MNTMPVQQLVLNEANPRMITDRKFQQLSISLLVFPRMLSIRPVVVEPDNTVLGGNMRTRVLQQLATLSIDEIKRRLSGSRDYKKLSDKEKAVVVGFWDRWLADPRIPVVVAEGLTDEQKRQFVIKDNASFGDWDWNKLANEWDNLDLQEWGLDVWGAEPPSDGDDSEESEETTSESAATVQTKITITVKDESQYEQILAAIQAAVEDYDCKVK